MRTLLLLLLVSRSGLAERSVVRLGLGETATLESGAALQLTGFAEEEGRAREITLRLGAHVATLTDGAFLTLEKYTVLWVRGWPTHSGGRVELMAKRLPAPTTAAPRREVRLGPGESLRPGAGAPFRWTAWDPGAGRITVDWGGENTLALGAGGRALLERQGVRIFLAAPNAGDSILEARWERPEKVRIGPLHAGATLELWPGHSFELPDRSRLSYTGRIRFREPFGGDGDVYLFRTGNTEVRAPTRANASFIWKSWEIETREGEELSGHHSVRVRLAEPRSPEGGF